MSNIRSAKKVDKKRLANISRRGRKRNLMLFCIKTNKHIHAYVYDCEEAKTVCSCSTVALKDLQKTWDINAAKKLGEAVAKLCQEKGIKEVFFNKLNYPFHGKVAALVLAARESGLII